jgi:hypothetical protein
MTDELKPLIEASAQSGWFFAGLTAVWGIVLRWIIGRHISQFDLLDAKLDSIDARLSVIEGRFEERDTGRYS